MGIEQNPAIEFFKQEYEGISKAFGDLYNVILKVFNFYLLLTALPFTVAAIIFKSQNSKLELSKLPSSLSALLLLVSFLGILITFSMIHLRMEQILYAKTINCIRRFFWEIGVGVSKKTDDCLTLPITDELPPFLELWRSFFWQIITIGIIDGVYLAVASINLFALPLWLVLFASFVLFLVHIVGYVAGALMRKRSYKIKCPAVSGRTENY